jgi:hypothetical protein
MTTRSAKDGTGIGDQEIRYQEDFLARFEASWLFLIIGFNVEVDFLTPDAWFPMSID